MSEIILPHRWRQQPQQPALRAEFAASCEVCMVGPNALDIAKGVRPAYGPGITPSGSAAGYGLALSGSQASTDQWYGLNRLVGASQVSAVVSLVPRSLTNAPVVVGQWGSVGADQTVLLIQAGASGELTTAVRSSGGTFYVWTTATSAVGINTVNNIAVSMRSGSTPVFAVNGKIYSSSRTSGPNDAFGTIPSGSASYLTIGSANASTQQLNAIVSLAYITRDYFTEQVLRELSGNPWQIFRPIPAHTWALMAGSAADFPLAVSPAPFTVNAQPVALKADRKLSVSPAAFAATGQAVTLTYTPANPVMQVTPASIIVTGQAVGLTYTPASGPCPTVDQIATAVYAKLLSEDFAGMVADAVIARFNAGAVPVNVQYVNGLTVDGAGTDADPWGPV